eukprot:jgi/Bigna1/142449/aug1.70_g17157
MTKASSIRKHPASAAVRGRKRRGCSKKEVSVLRGDNQYQQAGNEEKQRVTQKGSTNVAAAATLSTTHQGRRRRRRRAGRKNRRVEQGKVHAKEVKTMRISQGFDQSHFSAERQITKRRADQAQNARICSVSMSHPLF